MPELATSMVAAAKGNADIAVGNVVGSNIFNILGVLGISAVTRPIDAPDLSGVDLGVMALLGLVLLPLALSGKRLSRVEGAVFCVGYAGYVVYLLRAA